jgi:PBP1b-binding outer membrane lipoprotein LpoB
MNTLFKIASAIFLITMLFGCTQQEGPNEKLGKKLDNAVEQIKEGDNPLRDEGLGEKIGEGIDRSRKEEKL